MAERIVLKNVRLSYPHLFRPEKFDETQPAKWGCVLIIRKDDPQLETLKEIVARVGAEKWPQKVTGAKWPASLHYPIKDGDDVADEHPEYEDCCTISPTSVQPVTLLDRAKRPLDEDSGKLYPGCYVNASLSVAAFDAGVKKGVGVFLNGVQHFAEGERLAGHDVTADFEQLDEDDFDGYDI